MTNLRSVVNCLILVASTSIGATDLYRTVDENGNISFSDKPSEKAVEVELPKATKHSGASRTTEQNFYVSIRSNHEKLVTIWKSDELSIYRQNNFELISFLAGHKDIIEEYSDVIIQFTITDIPRCELKDYNRLSLRELFEDLGEYCRIDVKVAPNYIHIAKE